MSRTPRALRSTSTRLPAEQVWPWVSDPYLHVRTLPASVSDVTVRENGDIAW